MFRSLLVGTAVLALSAALAAPADAQNRGRQHGNHGHYDRGHDRRGDVRRDNRRHDQRRYDHRGASRGHQRDRYYAPPRQAVRHHRAPPVRYYHPPPRHVVRHRAPVVYHAPPPRVVWTRGSHYARHGYAPTYIVHDYRPYGLYTPPHGHYWRRSSAGDFVLVAIATGIIIDAILGH